MLRFTEHIRVIYILKKNFYIDSMHLYFDEIFENTIGIRVIAQNMN